MFFLVQKMKKINSYLSVLLIGSIFLTCSTPDESATAELVKEDLIGSWRLIKTIEIGHEDSTNRRDGEEKYYIKHVNNTHFIWSEYDRKSDQLLGTGGGTYTLEGNIYTEDIQFYFPSGSNELGQAIPFRAEMEDGIWHHTGYAKLFEFDPETAEVVFVDSAIIDELWERIEVAPEDDTNGKLLGTWIMLNYKEPSDSTWNEQPSFVRDLKILTPTHFTWISYNTGADEMYRLGGGTYSVSNDTYRENIQYWYPHDPGVIGISADFEWSIDEDDHWEINAGFKGPIPVHEIWGRYDTPDKTEVASSE